MIRLIECKNYRSLKYISQPLDNFQILVGPNASGKTTFLDVVSFMADIVTKGVEEAVFSRAPNFSDLTYAGKGGEIELAVEAELPEGILDESLKGKFNGVRYAVKIGIEEEKEQLVILQERVLLVTRNWKDFIAQKDSSEFPVLEETPDSLVFREAEPRPYRITILKANSISNLYFAEMDPFDEGDEDPRSFSFALGDKRSVLSAIPSEGILFRATAWFRNFLTNDIQKFVLDSLQIRKASPPGKGKSFRTDGSNLPWVIEELRKHPERFANWISHLQTALPDIRDIDTVERPEDRHRYLRVHYENDIVVPSWLVSDGTLRLLALTLPAYLPDFKGMYLIEEPENGIHPKAMETVLQSLSSVYGAQMILASHSPIILSQMAPEDVLCFAKTEEGITDIISGDKHPMLRDWQRDTDLGTLYAAGVLG